MSSAAEHIACANRTQNTIGHLLADAPSHSPWIAVAAFYKAIHVVEAVFFYDKNVRHTSNHDDRDTALRHNRRYDSIYKHYRPLKSASLNARYLTSCKIFDAYLSPDEVVGQLLKDHLHQIEQSAAKFIKDPDTLDRITALFKANP